MKKAVFTFGFPSSCVQLSRSLPLSTSVNPYAYPDTLILPWTKNATKPSSRGMNTGETASRLKTAAQHRPTLPKKAVLVQKIYSQSELLARALDTEEGSILEHELPRGRRGEAGAGARRPEGH
ncbi:hypothetical protein FIBSPDRAFT_875535 [Athelia psychrophila]|uniref:Uncharacterized protein n=1 Tax=Athelia psychrophila TaxID=1759441 RepID=A0A167XMH2_9AGAM|nr:hypothetical protein FIBSPDRAFT_875535 [Fibularhizoctonia sp. CBS 109695]